MLSHGYEDEDLHRVCIVDADGKIKKKFGGQKGSTIGQLDAPVYLAVDGNGFVMAVDLENSRVLLLDSELKFKGEFLSEEKHSLRYPRRIFLDESNNRIFVVENDSKDVRIVVFASRWFSNIRTYNLVLILKFLDVCRLSVHEQLNILSISFRKLSFSG